jgi:nicotinamide mononucleotide adenylyltransferase
MSTRTFALIFGIVFLAVGVAGFVPGLVQPLHAGHPEAMGNNGQLLGLFPVNELHNAVHILFGIWGLAASRSLGNSVTYARGVAIIYAVLTIAGFVPQLETMFGLVPLYGNDVWLHALLALVAAYFGWVNRNPATV